MMWLLLHNQLPVQLKMFTTVKYKHRPSFSPSDVSDLQFWFKADSLNLANNDPVTRWEDSGPRSAHATQSIVASQPIYKTNIINGKPVVRFDGSNDYLALTSASFSGMTVFAVGNPSGSAAYISYPPIDMKSGSANYDYSSPNSFMFQIPSTMGSTAIQFYSNGAKFNDSDAVALVTPTLITVTAVYNGPSDTTVTMTRNGTQILSHTNAAISSTLNPREGALGCRFQPGPSGTFMFGDIAELVVYSGGLDVGTRTRIETYLNEKYALY
jgi:hypothetical protein